MASNKLLIADHNAKVLTTTSLQTLLKLDDTQTINNSRNTSKPSKTVVLQNWSPVSIMFYKVVKDLGLFEMKDLVLKKVSNRMITSLKKAKNGVLVLRDEGGGNQKRQALLDFCEEFVDRHIVLAHENEHLAYEIKSVRCGQGFCHSNALKVTLGECVLKKKTMIVYVMDRNGKFAAKTIEPGCACECLHYPHLQ